MNNTLTARIVVRDHASRVISRIQDRFDRFNRSATNLNRNLSDMPGLMGRIGRASVNSGNKMERSFKNSNREAMELSQTLNRLLHLYLLTQGAQAMITTSDSITSARNKLNYINSESLGASGVTTNADGSVGYSKATLNATDSDMAKMYSSAQKVRTSYADMMSNVSKSMTLAPDAFQGNMDNAIRFQEIMAEAYTLGGASAQEMHSSMYQMIQALGSGILAGDELRSVREGAPLAYKEIEKFAQGIYNTEESLKDLASQGMITSEIVVAAMMQAGTSIDNAFAMTDRTFAQAWTTIKNAATQAFEPVFKQLNEFLNSDDGVATIQMIISFIQDLATVMNILLKVTLTVIGYIAKNWDWLKYLIYTVIGLLGLVIIVMGGLAAVSLVLRVALIAPWLVWVAIITFVVGLTVAVCAQIFQTSKSTVDGIVNVMLYLSYVILFVITGIVIAAALGLITITAGIYLVVMFIIAIVLLVAGLVLKYLDVVLGGFFGALEVIKAIFENIGIAWHNILVGMKQSFWLWIDDIINRFKPFLQLVNKALEAMGEKTIDLDFAANKANEVGGKLKYVDVGDAWDRGYNKGSTIGKNVHDKINSVGDKVTNLKKELDDGFNLDETALTGGTLDDIASDTSDISDAVALSAEDLEYLRKIAAMEWKKEYTTANIVVDMTNNNTISGDNDLDGIVTTLSKKLREELGEVANGVYI